ncbi:helix-turn-helix transcriptional regulator [Enterococcus sp. CSURQ0835]|uniref:helix-turn-helix transcriptional regulator n=1 Tax=Enterococcus sp. CSURQ0835 TaxID=2681394 RepID=UPI00135C6ABD|nr:helix-turn-helix transcriptional regulator [Enterococcus sp. CSURQ0835]
MNFLSRQLKKYRTENELTQKQLAEQLFVSDKAISKWETGRGFPDVESLPKVAALLDLTVDDLLNERAVSDYFEYKSERCLKQWPLLHIVLPRVKKVAVMNNPSYFKLGYKIPTATGVIAIGLRATGVISIGVLAQGVFALGFLSVGIISLGLFGIGLLALGDLSLGLLAIGNVGCGLLVIGNCVAGVLASGNLTFGWVAIGNQSYGWYHFSLGDDFTFVMYQNAVEKIHEKLQLPLVDVFYRITLWLGSHPVIIGVLVLGLLLGILSPIGIIYLKRKPLFSSGEV